MLNLIVAGTCWLLAGASYWWSSQTEKRKQEIMSIQSTKCRDLEPGRKTEVKGTVKALTPLPVPERPGECVYYRIERRQERMHTRREADGKIHSTPEWETIEARTESRRFLVEDETGSVLVDLQEGAEVDAPLVVDKNEQSPGNTLSAGGFRLSLGGGKPTTTRVWALVPGQPVYVLGQAESEGSRVVLKSGEQKLVVSYKSEEELLRGAQRDASFGKVIAAALLAAGAAAFFLIK